MSCWQLLSITHDKRPHRVPHWSVLPIAWRYRSSAMPHWIFRGFGRELELHTVATRQLCASGVQQCRYHLHWRYICCFYWIIKLHPSCSGFVFD